MSQNDYIIANDTAANVRADINLALAALASNSSGANAPSTTYANMLWYDTTANILKMRSEADDAWINLGTLDQSTNTFTPAGAIPAPASPVDGDLLVRSGGAWVRLPKGAADQVLKMNAGATGLEWVADPVLNLASLCNPTAGNTVRFQDSTVRNSGLNGTITYYGFSPAGEGVFRLKIDVRSTSPGSFLAQSLVYKNGVLALTLNVTGNVFTQVTGDLTYQAGDNFRVDVRPVTTNTTAEARNLIFSTNGEDFWPVSEVVGGPPLWTPAG